MQKMSSRMPCTHEPWVLLPANNCTMCFITPQKSHFQVTKMQKMNSYKGMFPWTVGYTSRKNSIFRSQKWRKSTQTKRSTLEQWVTRLGKNRIFIPQNAENELTRKYVPLNRLFNESAEIVFSGRQSAENELTNLGILEPWVSRFGSNRILRSSKSRKWAHTNLRTLETWVSRLGKNCIFRAKKWKSPHPKRGTLQPFDSRLDKNRVFRPPSAGSVCICSFVFRTCGEKQCSCVELVQRK